MASERVTIKSSDNKLIEIDLKVAKMFRSVKELSNASDEEIMNRKEPVDVNNVRHCIILKIVEWAEHHKDDPESEEEDSDEDSPFPDQREVPQWDQEFVQELDQSILLETLQSCNLLGVKPLLKICCKTVANSMKGKSVEEVRVMFGITSIEHWKRKKNERKKAQTKRNQ